ncbi:hypothetical protein [Aureimonas glaciei]|uniref:Uncharacterized protein n=1 Tax=Aureimonas glaciei TaxID=1776957 RepID=A0A916Y4S7_9HYPH|nr:hypothetical protein [Aureimonas glaciei]GGD30615.1 hypothetical protein GCM10011335_37080 [Aureimonas glaciei]
MQATLDWLRERAHAAGLSDNYIEALSEQARDEALTATESAFAIYQRLLHAAIEDRR